jgi:outer membrane immunogenic protein
MRSLLLSSVAFAALAGQALAGDLPSTKGAPVYVAPAFTWTGFYVGGNVGVGVGSAGWSNLVIPGDSDQNIPGNLVSQNMNGAVGGLQAGYNMQFGQFVGGLEVGVDFAGLDARQSCFGNYGDYTAQCTNKLDGIVDLTARFGYLITDRTWIYARAGGAYSWGSVQPANEIGPYGTAGYQSSDVNRWGWLVGAGVEYALTDHWTFGVDYKYMDFGSSSVGFASLPPALLTYAYASPNFFANVAIRDVQTVTAKVNYKFGGPEVLAPVVAKY